MSIAAATEHVVVELAQRPHDLRRALLLAVEVAAPVRLQLAAVDGRLARRVDHAAAPVGGVEGHDGPLDANLALSVQRATVDRAVATQRRVLHQQF